MMEINNRLEATENMRREREGTPWTEDEIRVLIQSVQAGWHVDAIAFDLKRNKSEVILQGLELGVLTVERTEWECSDQQYLNILHSHAEDAGMANGWNEFSPEPRTLDKIQYMVNVFREKLWYMYHLCAQQRIEQGLEQVDPETWAKALEAADAILQKYGAENLVPRDDFEWGMLHGKLSALRWVMGSEWDFLDL